MGLSDHTASIYPAIAAMARGADIVECHVVFDRRSFGPDSSSSLTLHEFKILVEARDAINLIMNNPVNKDDSSKSMNKMRSLFSRSLALTKDARKGDVITSEMLTRARAASRS